MIINIILLIIGFVLLIKGADFFVDGAASTAKNFKVSNMLIGLTIVAFGTSAPELAVSLKAMATGSADVVLGNVVGSNITNILLIIGVGALICPIKIKDNTVKKELPICILISMALVTLLLDIPLSKYAVNEITRSDGIAILLFFSIFLYYVVSLSKSKREDEEEYKQYGILKSILLLVGGLLGVIYGSDLVVNNATELATSLGISERVISLTIIAFGTSLPELVTTIVSAKKGEQDILVGNIIGSNVFNICVVLGIPTVIYGSLIPSVVSLIDMTFLILSAIMLYIFSKTKRKITRTDASIMLITFAIYYLLIFVL